MTISYVEIFRRSLVVLIPLIFVKLMDNVSELNKFYEKRVYKICSVICLSLIFLLMEFVPYLDHILVTILSLMFLTIFASKVYISDFSENLVLVFTYWSVYINCGSVITIFSRFENFRNFFEGASNSSLSLLITLFIYLATYLISEYVLSKILDYKNYFFTNKELVGLISLNLIIIAINIFSVVDFFSFSLSVLSLIVVLILSAMIKIVRQKEEREKLLVERNRFLEKQDKLFQQKESERYKSYQKSIKIDNEIRRINHDLMHHFNYILSCESMSQIKEYINKLKSKVSESGRYFETGSSILDLILEEKFCEARKAGIEFKVIGDFSDGVDVEPLSLSIIFGNLIDNAIEGCKKVSEDKHRTINIIFYQEPHKNFYLKILNTAKVEDLNFVDGEYKSTKEITKDDKDSHGIGLNSVKLEVDRYEGKMEVSVDERMFVVEITIPVK